MAWHGAAPRMAVRAANARRADSRAPDRDAIAILRRSPSPDGLELHPEDFRSRCPTVEEERKQARGTEVGRAAAGQDRRRCRTFNRDRPCPRTFTPPPESTPPTP